jgi:hypothetical protein
MCDGVAASKSAGLELGDFDAPELSEEAQRALSAHATRYNQQAACCFLLNCVRCA